jgi:hypothetical protein
MSVGESVILVEHGVEEGDVSHFVEHLSLFSCFFLMIL